ncbi:hypothetical protein CYMTET_15663, partial [Cymbomonas tetramitiformis]
MTDSFGGKLAAQRRRLSTQMRHSLSSKDEATGDEKIAQLLSEFEAQSAFVNSVRKDFQDNIKVFEKVQGVVTKLSEGVMEATSRLGLLDVKPDLAGPFCGIKGGSAAVAAAMQNDLTNLDAQIEEHKIVSKMITEQKRLKLDFDHYDHKVKGLKATPGEKLVTNEQKLKSAKTAVDTATAAL